MGIPDGERTHIAQTHIDTDLLMGILDNTGKDDLHDIGRHLVNQATRRKPLGISIPTIGEAFHKLCEKTAIAHTDKCREAMAILHSYFHQGKLELVGTGRDKKVYEIAHELMEADYNMCPTDALILSIACVTEPCTIFLTTDRPMIDSLKVSKIAKANNTKIRPPRITVR